MQEIFDCFSFKMFLENENADFADIINFCGRLFKADRYPYGGVKTSTRSSVCRLHMQIHHYFFYLYQRTRVDKRHFWPRIFCKIKISFISLMLTS